MKTPAYDSIDPFATKNLTMIFPLFFMAIYLLPLYYMVTKLAEERETRAREGMKMMGLTDQSYFAAWLIFMSLICAVVSVLYVLTGSFYNIFVKSDLMLIFLMGLFYGVSLYGFAFTMVAFLPSRKSSATAATILHLLSYYPAFMYSGYSSTNA